MSAAPEHVHPTSASPRTGYVAAAILALVVALAYGGSFSGPFVFDDIPAIVENPSIRHLWPPADVLWPRQAGGLTTSGRPLVNLSLAINYAISGREVWSYHAVNLLIHLAAALALFGVVRRTLVRCQAMGASGGRPIAWLPRDIDPTLVALAIAALWAAHPLQTESVTYVVQRAESLAGLFYLLTLYCFIRALPPPDGGARRWGWAAVLACAAGMASKEVVVSAPLMALLYDRTFVAGSFREAWRARRSLYLGLAATWLLVAALVLQTGARGGTAGFAPGISPWHYLLTQADAIPGYLGRCFWPEPLIFDHGVATRTELLPLLPQAVAVLALLGATVFALWRAPVPGFLGAWFFAVLAPSSSFVPIATQTVAEHRMYLPLAAVVTATVLVLVRWLRARWPLTIVILALVALPAARKRDYRSEAALWADTAAKLPSNARAHNNLGQALFRAGNAAAAEASYRRALELQPKYPETHYNLAVALVQRGEVNAAIEHYETALRYQPAYPEAENNLGNALVASGRPADALPHYEVALRLKPDFAEAENNLGNALLCLKRIPDAVGHLRRALELKPGYPEAHYNLGNALAAGGDMNAALSEYRSALRQDAGYATAHVNAGNALVALGRPVEAVTEYEAALATAPSLVEAHLNAGLVLIDLARFADAVPHLEAVVRARRDAVEAQRALGFALVRLGRPAEALPHYEAYVQAAPGDSEAKAELRQLRAALRR